MITLNFIAGRGYFYGKYPIIFKALKPLIAPVSYYNLYSNMIKVPSSLTVFCIGCFLGDIFLLSRDLNMNVLGCISFLIAHAAVFYYLNVSWRKINFKYQLIITLPFAIANLYFLAPKILKYKRDYIFLFNIHTPLIQPEPKTSIILTNLYFSVFIIDI